MTDDFKTEQAEKIELRAPGQSSELPAGSLDSNESPLSAQGLSTASVPMPFLNLPPQYEVLELIGQGGMGQVYKARISGVSELVAVKVLRKELCSDAQAVKRFQQEITAVSSLTHANIVEVLEHGITSENIPYLTMKFVDGESLESLLQREGAIEWERAVDIFLQVAAALEYAHGRGTVHRDLKPSNIVVSKNALGVETAHIADFGIAKLVTASGDTVNTMTAAGEFMGTPAYMSPEQCLGQEVDFRSDIYSLGCTLFAALSGQNPYAGCGTVETIAKKLSDQAPPQLTSQAIPPNLKILVASCMNRQPRDRYNLVNNLNRDLAAIAHGDTPQSHLVSPVLDEKALGKRFAAFWIDYFIIMGAYGIISLVCTIVFIPLSVLTNNWAMAQPWAVYFWLVSYVVVVFGSIVFYKAWMESRFGATPGKMLMRLVVCDLEGKKITLKRALARNGLRVLFFYGLPALIFYVLIGLRSEFDVRINPAFGLLYPVSLIVWTMAKRQVPWDLVSKTRVRRKN
ncbi:MAG: protein kinase [Candidatus Melainabacteria bacterium]|nr:protein kinase [Candidatus Melainabacteria bacterium]